MCLLSPELTLWALCQCPNPMQLKSASSDFHQLVFCPNFRHHSEKNHTFLPDWNTLCEGSCTVPCTSSLSCPEHLAPPSLPTAQPPDPPSPCSPLTPGGWAPTPVSGPLNSLLPFLETILALDETIPFLETILLRLLFCWIHVSALMSLCQRSLP